MVVNLAHNPHFVNVLILIGILTIVLGVIFLTSEWLMNFRPNKEDFFFMIIGLVAGIVIGTVIVGIA